MRKKTEEVFLKEVSANNANIEVLGKFVNTRTKIEVRCKVCGRRYMVSPNSLTRGVGCQNCAGLLKKTAEQFVEEMRAVNPNIEVLGNYVQNKEKILVRCKICHSEWRTTPNSLLSGRGCKKCSGLQKHTNEEFVAAMKALHPEIDVLDTYTNNYTRVKCFCNRCKSYFYGLPHSMLDTKSGCTFCSKSNSRGELAILDWLRQHNIDFVKEYRFKECKNKIPLPFDFYLPSKNTVVEFDGKQHYEVTPFFNGEAGYLQTKTNDKIKNEFCKNHNIKLIRIPYWDIDNVDKILTDKLTI